MVIRNDDVSHNSDIEQLIRIYYTIHQFLPNCEIWNCVSVFSKRSVIGSVYPNLPLKAQKQSYFFDVTDTIGAARNYGNAKTVSHGLWHLDHSKASEELQESSIVTSCRLLRTNIFVPPFNNWNGYTEKICDDNRIRLIKSEDEGWKSFEYNEFDPSHELWYFHSWKWSPDKLKGYLVHGINKVYA